MQQHTINEPSKSASEGDRISIFQQGGMGEKKIQGIRAYGNKIEIVEIIDFPENLPDFIDNPADFFPDHLQGTLVLSFLKHPDLADYAAEYCANLGVPMVASGPRKIAGATSPFTCCGLAKTEDLGRYGQQFGIPEYEIRLKDGRIAAITVLRGASCGATWLSLPKLLGCTPEEALKKVAREAQFLCQADPSSFDPITGHSPLHFAGNIHTKALEKALKKEKA